METGKAANRPRITLPLTAFAAGALFLAAVVLLFLVPGYGTERPDLLVSDLVLSGGLFGIAVFALKHKTEVVKTLIFSMLPVFLTESVSMLFDGLPENGPVLSAADPAGSAFVLILFGIVLMTVFILVRHLWLGTRTERTNLLPDSTDQLSILLGLFLAAAVMAAARYAASRDPFLLECTVFLTGSVFASGTILSAEYFLRKESPDDLRLIAFSAVLDQKKDVPGYGKGLLIAVLAAIFCYIVRIVLVFSADGLARVDHVTNDLIHAVAALGIVFTFRRGRDELANILLTVILSTFTISEVATAFHHLEALFSGEGPVLYEIAEVIPSTVSALVFVLLFCRHILSGMNDSVRSGFRHAVHRMLTVAFICEILEAVFGTVNLFRLGVNASTLAALALNLAKHLLHVGLLFLEEIAAVVKKRLSEQEPSHNSVE